MAASAALPAWAPVLHDLVVNEPASEQAGKERMGELLAAIVSAGGASGAGDAPAGVTRVVRLVEALGPYLTSENDAQRARATAVLAEVGPCPGVVGAGPCGCRRATGRGMFLP